MADTISEFSKNTQISEHTLRYYEKEGLLKPIRDEHNYRLYSEKDYDWIHFINKLKRTGISLKEMKRYAYLREIGDETITERKELLLKHREQVLLAYEKVKENLSLLDDKITLYRQMEKAQDQTE
ncbi:MerR family transcriptional regulator [Isobaculum melis]|uniref:DNA-binding transcriptional regulator, MerR family n=1 Tax=Isobaculum melis TaxID=142588 RepID=A0A1H9SSU7_9LACT|nr:MerR family transcriptional regulator [Isobaculum melis]SER88080.1 DNA-binding transcriptional regulator, MerR family [Isobaculum melis]